MEMGKVSGATTAAMFSHTVFLRRGLANGQLPIKSPYLRGSVLTFGMTRLSGAFSHVSTSNQQQLHRTKSRPHFFCYVINLLNSHVCHNLEEKIFCYLKKVERIEMQKSG